jgi:hypothetical protein
MLSRKDASRRMIGEVSGEGLVEIHVVTSVLSGTECGDVRNGAGVDARGSAVTTGVRRQALRRLGGTEALGERWVGAAQWTSAM